MSQGKIEMQKKIGSITALAANFGREFPKPLLKMWLELLAPYSPEAVEQGVIELIGSYAYKTVPPFAVLKRILDKAIIPEEIQLDAMAEAEWNRLLSGAERFGRYNPPDFCPTTAYALRSMGGWDAVCSWKTGNLEWRRKEFLELWKLAYGREEVMALGSGAVLAAANGPSRAGNILAAAGIVEQKALNDAGHLPA